MFSVFRISSLAVILTLFALGCGRSDSVPRYELNGEVTFAGKPVPYGEILLTPDQEKSNVGPSSVIEIRDGKFQTESENGHVGGAYTAVITGFDGVAPAKPDPLNPSLKGQVLFENYQTSFELPKSESTQKIEVDKKR